MDLAPIFASFCVGSAVGGLIVAAWKTADPQLYWFDGPFIVTDGPLNSKQVEALKKAWSADVEKRARSVQ